MLLLQAPVFALNAHHLCWKCSALPEFQPETKRAGTMLLFSTAHRWTEQHSVQIPVLPCVQILGGHCVSTFQHEADLLE